MESIPLFESYRILTVLDNKPAGLTNPHIYVSTRPKVLSSGCDRESGLYWLVNADLNHIPLCIVTHVQQIPFRSTPRRSLHWLIGCLQPSLVRAFQLLEAYLLALHGRGGRVRHLSHVGVGRGCVAWACGRVGASALCLVRRLSASSCPGISISSAHSVLLRGASNLHARGSGLGVRLSICYVSEFMRITYTFSRR
jgi:hypothetical protein